eukprot:g11647.t1
MMMNIWTCSPLLLLAPGAVSGAPVENGLNTCLDEGHIDYSCSLSPGSLTIDMTGCGLVDGDLPTLDTCIESGGAKKEPITFIKFGDNSFSEFPEDFFQPFASTLGHLHLEENDLRVLPPKIFAGMSSLIKLHLEDNNLTSLPSGLLDGLVNLDTVDLSGNAGLQCAPSTNGTRVQPNLLILPANFTTGHQCECVAGGCEVDCAPGDDGYVCSGVPAPSPMATPPPTEAGSAAPTGSGSAASTHAGTGAPTHAGTAAPTHAGTAAPTHAGTAAPTHAGTAAPTHAGTAAPTHAGTAAPTHAGTAAPTHAGTAAAPTTNPPERMCHGDIAGIQVGDVCCKPECTQCGGVECGESAAAVGLTEKDCCINQIIAVGEVCGGDVVAPCINYESTPAPALPCSIQETEDACKGERDCLQCMYVTTIEQETTWKECFKNYNVTVADPCSSSTGMTCCLAEIEDDIDCLRNPLFVAYSECFVENSSGGADCSTPLTCNETSVDASEQAQGSAAGRLASTSPLHRVEPLVVGMILALLGAVILQ